MDNFSFNKINDTQYELLVFNKNENGEYNVLMDYKYKDNISVPVFTNDSLGGIFININWDEIDKEKMYDSHISFNVCQSSDRKTTRHIYICEYDDCPPCLLNILITRCYFHPVEKSIKYFSKYTRDAYYQYIKEKENKTDDIVEESYFTNYINNIFQLYKFKDKKDFTTEYIDKFIKSKLTNENCKKIYNKNKKDIENRLTLNDETDELLYFVDRVKGANVSVYVSFDKKNEFSIASAGTIGNTNSSAIVLSPLFFGLDFDLKKFTLLHELGHIRLNHCTDKNMKMTIKDMILNRFTDTNEYRAKMINKDKIMYPEVNADLYAVIHGANISEFLKIKDVIKLDNDAIRELKNRESTVNSKYNKMNNSNKLKLGVIDTIGKLFTK